jgi:Cu(I)/Ag(I) efflux system membrane fusion protein
MGSTTKQLAAPGTQSTSARLRNYGMGDQQIAEIASTHQMPENVNIVSPANGFIIARNVASGQRFDKSVELYRIADLSHVWIMAEVVESEAQYLRHGIKASVRLPGSGGELQARVSSVLPQFDPTSGTVNVRLEAGNPSYELRPGMLVDLEIKVKIPVGLEVPADALLDAGTEQRIYVQRDDGNFEPRAVKTGMRVGDRVEVLSGLDAGDRVVVEGTFLLDSESRLKSVVKTRHGEDGQSHAAPSGQSVTAPAHVSTSIEVARHFGGQS